MNTPEMPPERKKEKKKSAAELLLSWLETVRTGGVARKQLIGESKISTVGELVNAVKESIQRKLEFMDRIDKIIGEVEPSFKHHRLSVFERKPRYGSTWPGLEGSVLFGSEFEYLLAESSVTDALQLRIHQLETFKDMLLAHRNDDESLEAFVGRIRAIVDRPKIEDQSSV